MLKNFIVGILIAGVGAMMVIYTEKIMQFAGRMEWAEYWIRVFGGTRFAYKLIGLIAIIIGFMMATGLLGPVVLWLFRNMFSAYNPTPPPEI